MIDTLRPQYHTARPRALNGNIVAHVPSYTQKIHQQSKKSCQLQYHVCHHSQQTTIKWRAGSLQPIALVSGMGYRGFSGLPTAVWNHMKIHRIDANFAINQSKKQTSLVNAQSQIRNLGMETLHLVHYSTNGFQSSTFAPMSHRWRQCGSHSACQLCNRF